MQRDRGFESLQPLQKRPACAGLFRCSSRAVRLRHRTMTRQSCPRQLADAGRNASRQDGLPRIARKYQGFRQGTDSQDGGDSGRQAVVPPSRVGESPQFANFSWATRRRRRRWRVFQEETRSRKASGDRSCALAPSGLGSDRRSIARVTPAVRAAPGGPRSGGVAEEVSG
jgi:hypothetical protein